MRTLKHVARKARVIPFPITFQCTCCAVVEHRRTHALPRGWQTEAVRGDIQAYCPECSALLVGRLGK